MTKRGCLLVISIVIVLVGLVHPESYVMKLREDPSKYLVKTASKQTKIVKTENTDGNQTKIVQKKKSSKRTKIVKTENNKGNQTKVVRKEKSTKKTVLEVSPSEETTKNVVSSDEKTVKKVVVSNSEEETTKSILRSIEETTRNFVLEVNSGEDTTQSLLKSFEDITEPPVSSTEVPKMPEEQSVSVYTFTPSDNKTDRGKPKEKKKLDIGRGEVTRNETGSSESTEIVEDSSESTEIETDSSESTEIITDISDENNKTVKDNYECNKNTNDTANNWVDINNKSIANTTNTNTIDNEIHGRDKHLVLKTAVTKDGDHHEPVNMEDDKEFDSKIT